VFNLGTHGFVDCHIGNVERYQYDASLINKLVLPADHKEIIDALTSAASKRMSDIIKGKAQGVIILCSGLPGTGKTLSAEVYSEAIQRPLYMVQCSQLGTNADKLEENLAGVLERATRWRAILLIDEADVYIHERGSDVEQNAIVGVFLRLLEYYNGILFLTTNLVTVVDDAILSRATAHVKYGVPKDDEERDQLWKVLCAQYGVNATPSFLKEVTRDFPKISGRSIRQLIRLSKVMADRDKGEVTASRIRWASKFHDFTEME
jgi:AAA+ superfamily predicted ATPase